MRILKISGRNLASLAGDFAIDFEQEPLASAGLFAISGPTGAGKSTILDALCLALYDATPRLLKTKRAASVLPDVGSDTVSVQDPRTLLRRGAAEAFAEVDFIGNDMQRYRARWSVRRSRAKAAGALQKSAMSLHRLPELIALGGTNTEVAAEIVLRVGLNFEQFTRAVLLAQNEFSAFLKTDENERGELLETLTGSAVYSALSRRAFERFRQEQATMQQLGARLADHAPLPDEQRAALEQQASEAESALALADARTVALEQQLRWHQEDDRLRLNQQLAEQELAAAAAAVDGAAARRQQLAAIDAAEPARALVADRARLDGEIAAIGQAIAAAAAQALQLQAAQAQAEAALGTATASLDAAELAQQQARPALDQAKALDASIATLAPSHAKAAEARLHAHAQLSAAADALRACTLQLEQASRTRQQGADWLAAHGSWDALAVQWPRWDTLLGQAGQASADSAALGAQLASASEAIDAASAAERQTALALHQAAASASALEAARQQAIATLAAFDGAALLRQRQQLDARRSALATAASLWQELAAARARMQQLERQGAELAAAQAAASSALASAAACASAVDAGLAQAERSLAAAELACADSVTDLRATLSDGAPCPVCGSAAHPYRQHDPALHGMLASLRAQVTRCRVQVQDNRSTQATQQALLTSSAQQLAALAGTRAAEQAALARLSSAWEAAPLDTQATAAADRSAWFSVQLDAIDAALVQLAATEQAARAAAATRDLAQQACDASAARLALARHGAEQARADLANAQARHVALADRLAHANLALAALLTELDQAFAPGWRGLWQQDHAAYRSARAAEVAQWRTRQLEHAGCIDQCTHLEAAHAGASLRHAQAAAAQAAGDAEFARLDGEIGARQAARMALWDGQAVSQVELALAAAIDAARALLATHQAALQAAAQALVRAHEAQAQGGARLQAASVAAQHAGARLDAWIAATAEVADRAALDALLAHAREQVAHERAALQALDAAAASAATVLAERRNQRALHGQAAVPGAAAQALEALAAQAGARSAALDAASALRLQLAQDNVRRENAQAMLAEMTRQRLVELRWGRLNELIGSADGKKFRNYAQQFTLDVLLGYANQHLGELARRYRLERVASSAGPSLGLLVRDQDMGGEIRSVNSLSGGESFLVSLALALGLASLSSNRVRVESLFIDEGFGSLDSETLRVAMDALDGLQSLGRKVGVISHVQEMTERIATRILVQPAGAGTSSVTVQ